MDMTANPQARVEVEALQPEVLDSNLEGANRPPVVEGPRRLPMGEGANHQRVAGPASLLIRHL